VRTKTIRPEFTPTVEPLINANEAAKLLGLHPVTVRVMAAGGRLPAVKIGRVWRFRESSLDSWIEEELDRTIKRDQ
jgi:excisionase family DNA binding protein